MSTHPVTFPWLLVPVSSSLLHHISVLTVKIQKKTKKQKNKKKTQQNPQDRSFPFGPLNKSSKNIYKQDYFKTKGVSPTVKICLISASEALSVMLPTNTVVVEVEFAWF